MKYRPPTRGPGTPHFPQTLWRARVSDSQPISFCFLGLGLGPEMEGWEEKPLGIQKVEKF